MSYELQAERFSKHRTLALWGRLMERAETAVKGKIEGGRERVRQETPNRSLSSAFIHSPLHLGIQKSACGLIPFSFHRQFRKSSFEEKYLLFGQDTLDDLQIYLCHFKH